MNNTPDLVVRAEMDYRVERMRRSWASSRRRGRRQRETRETARRPALRVDLG